MSILTASGISLSKPITFRVLKFWLKFPPFLTPLEKPSSLTGRFNLNGEFSLISKKSKCKILSVTG